MDFVPRIMGIQDQNVDDLYIVNLSHKSYHNFIILIEKSAGYEKKKNVPMKQKKS